MALCVSEFSPRRCRRDPSRAAEARERRRFLGKRRIGCVRDHASHHVFLQLEIRDFLYGSVLVYRPLFQLFERLLSPLRGESGQTNRLGRKQLRKNLQLALFLQRLPRRTPFPAESALDKNGSFPPEHCRAAKRGRRSHHQTRAYARLFRSGFTEARRRWWIGRSANASPARTDVGANGGFAAQFLASGKGLLDPPNHFPKLARNFSFFASQSSCNRLISLASCFSSDSASSNFPELRAF